MPIRILPDASYTYDQLPAPVDGVVTIPDNYAFFFSGTMDLMGARLVLGENVSFVGTGSENSILKSTGLVGQPLITSIHSVPLQNMTITADIALDLNNGGTASHDWIGVRFLDCNTIGVVKDCTTFLLNNCQFTNSQGLVFDGTIRAIAFTGCGFSVSTGGTGVTILPTCTLIRRIRFVYCAFTVNSGCTGINVSTAASIPSESYILDSVSFLGAGTYITGVPNTDDKALFQSTRGITASSTVGHCSMTNNVTATNTTTANTFVKIAGTTNAGPLVERFTHSNNRLTYTGSLAGFFQVTAVCTISTAINVSFSVRAAKNGVTSAAGEATIRQQSSATFSSATVQDVFSLSTGDYIELFIAATNAGQSVVIQDLNILIKKLN